MLFRRRSLERSVRETPPIVDAPLPSASPAPGPAPDEPIPPEARPVPWNAGAGMTVISPRTRIRGTLKGDGSLLVQGRFEGEIAVGGGVTVAEGGTIEADVRAPVIEVAGRVRGAIVASSRMTIDATGIVEGTVAAPVLDLQPGSVVRGKARIAGAASRDRSVLSH